jgi:putative addiction module component (TIGR02574 family)
MNHTSLHDAALTQLSLPERVELAQRLWDSVHADACAAPFTPEQLAELDRRIEAIDSGEVVCEPWETVRDRLHSEPR